MPCPLWSDTTVTQGQGEPPAMPSRAVAVTDIGAGRQENAFQVCGKQLLPMKWDGKEPLPTPAASLCAEELGVNTSRCLAA